MLDMEVILPGGVLIKGNVERHVRFNRVTGNMEMALVELDRSDDLSYASSLLELVLESIGDHPVDRNVVDSLTPADRQFLMLRLAAMLEGELVWLKATCGKCGSPFDVEIRRCDLPVKEAGEGYPQINVQLASGSAVVRVPTAADQISIMHFQESEAVKRLLERCLISLDSEAAMLSEEDIERIDDALDRISPAVCSELLVECPECHAEQRAVLNHYRLAGLNAATFLNEIHTLAMYYHWSEEEILSMSRERRHRYLKLIDRSRSMTGGEA